MILSRNIKKVDFWLLRLNYHLTLRQWTNRTTWLNYTFIRSCKITFLIYKVSIWKFGKRNKRQSSTSVKLFLVKILKKFETISTITVNYKIFCKIFHSNEVDRGSLSCSVVVSKFSGRYFVKWKSYLTRTFTAIFSHDLVDPWP